jgi:hypothetical protein
MRRILIGGHLAIVLLWGADGRAGNDYDDIGDGRAGTEEDRVSVPMTPSMMGPGRAAEHVYVGVEGGWDGPRRGAAYETNIEGRVMGPVSLRAGATSSLAGVSAKASPSFFLKVDLLRQDQHGIAGALFGGYRGEGFNLVPALEVGIALAHRSDHVSLISTAAYGQGLERSERYGDVRVAGMLRLHSLVDVGLDARARFDLEIDDDEPPGEAAVDGVAGPIFVWRLGPVSVSGQAGVGVIAPRSGGGTRVGPTTRLGVGAAF